MELKEVTRKEAEEHVKAGGGAFFLMDKSGDTKQIWDPNVPEETEAAEMMFDKLVTNGKYSAFQVGEDGEKSTRMTKFDAKAGKMILVPQMFGG